MRVYEEEMVMASILYVLFFGFYNRIEPNAVAAAALLFLVSLLAHFLSFCFVLKRSFYSLIKLCFEKLMFETSAQQFYVAFSCFYLFLCTL